MRILGALLAAAVLGIGAFWGLSGDTVPGASQKTALDDQMENTQTSKGGLGNEAADPRAGVLAAQLAAIPRPAAPAYGELGNEVEEEGALPTRAQVVPKASTDDLASLYSQDSPSGLSKKRTRSLRSKLDGLVDSQDGLELAGVECKSRSCRIELLETESSTDNAGLKAQGLLDALSDERGFLGQVESMSMARQGQTFSVYLRYPEQVP